MKNKITFLLFFFICAISFGQVIVSEDFTYADGNLVGNGTWAAHSGAGTNAVQVASNQISLTHGSGTREDVNISFTSASTVKYVGFDIIVTNGSPISGTDSEYFAHFNTSGFVGRIDVVPPSGAGDFSIGIAATSSSADTTWATDLTFGVTYRIIVKYDESNGQAQLWVNPSLETDTSILSATGSATTVTKFAFRQSNSSSDETITIDNLVVSESFMDSGTLSVTENTSNNNFTIYPNPVVGTSQVTVEGFTNSKAFVTVHNMLGKEVINTTITNKTLDVSALTTGIYMVRIVEENSKKSTVKKLIVK